MNKIEKFEPKKTNRFLVRFPEELDIPKELIYKIKRPTYHIHDNEWAPMEIGFHDSMSYSVSKKLLVYVNDNVIGRDIDETVCLFTFHIDIVDPKNVVIESWVINVNKILSIDFPELSYYSDEVSQCKMLIKPLSCMLIV